MSNKVYINNLPPDVTPAELRELFAHFGVKQVDLPMDGTGHAHGYALITLSTPLMAQLAAEQVRGFALHGRPLTVNESRPEIAPTAAPVRPGT